MGNQQERLNCEIAWLAAVIECEGWVSLVINSGIFRKKRRYKYEPICGLCNTDVLLIEECERILKKYGIEYCKVKRKGSTISNKSDPLPRFEIVMRCIPRVKKTLDLIFPYLIGIKKYRAEKILEFMKVRGSKAYKSAPYDEREHEIYKDIYKTITISRSRILNDFTSSTDM